MIWSVNLIITFVGFYLRLLRYALNSARKEAFKCKN